jgi:hypothetical protein
MQKALATGFGQCAVRVGCPTFHSSTGIGKGRIRMVGVPGTWQKNIAKIDALWKLK